jgi:hypothetical protein
MALAVVLSENQIVAIENTSSPFTAATKADTIRSISGRNFRPVERYAIGAEYGVYQLDREDVSLLSDPDRHFDPKYVGYVMSNCKHIASFAAQR